MKEVGIVQAAKQGGNLVAQRKGCESSGSKNREFISNLLKKQWDQEGLQKAKEDVTALCIDQEEQGQ